MIAIITRGKAIDVEAIDNLQAICGLFLPKDYTSFLKEFNGGIPEPNIFEKEGKKEVSLSVNTFFGIGLDSINDICIQLNELKERIPQGCLPIARAEGGDILCLNLANDNYGQIFLWEHERELECNSISNMEKLALTFDELLHKMKPYSPEDVDMSKYEVKNVWIDPDFLKELEN